jgi:hypothetical protein
VALPDVKLERDDIHDHDAVEVAVLVAMEGAVPLVEYHQHNHRVVSSVDGPAARLQGVAQGL